jgi:hypothetical protein
MTTDDFACLEALLDKKFADIHARVEAHDDDIKAFKAIFGAAVWLGGAILAIVVVLQGWYHK